MLFTCKICGDCDAHPTWTVQERMFGMGDEFLYFQCKRCSCLQVVSIPQNLSRYYPLDYYSFSVAPVPISGVKAILAARRDRAALWGRKNLLERMVPAGNEIDSLRFAKVSAEARILDVGCGNGQLLRIMWRAGFKNLSGIDPFIRADKEVAPSVIVQKKRIEDMDTTFDLIMLHHVFEHMPDGEAALMHCKRLIKANGQILLRFPSVDSFAWRTYREKWVQLDAPRHLFLHCRKSIELMCARLKLRLAHWSCDSSEFQFLGSEIYLKGMRLSGVDFGKHFSRTEIRGYRREARRLNRAGDGDQVVAILVSDE